MLLNQRIETLADGKCIENGGEMVGPYNPTTLPNTDLLRVDLTLEILNGCEHACPGCHIKRTRVVEDEFLASVMQYTEVMNNWSHVSLEEINIGPTDIFSATNFDYVMSHELMRKLCSLYSLTFNTTLNNTYEQIQSRMQTIDALVHDLPARDILFLVVIDLAKWTSGDIIYTSQLESKLQLISQYTVMFIVNYSDELLKYDVPTIAKQLFQRYNCVLRIIGGYLRSYRKDYLIKRNNNNFIDFQIDNKFDDHCQYLQMNLYNRHFNGHGFFTHSFINGELYVSPYMYEGIPIEHPMFKINKNKNNAYTTDVINTKHKELMITQMQHASSMDECADCNLLSVCASRNVISYAKLSNVTECLMPKEMIK